MVFGRGRPSNGDGKISRKNNTNKKHRNEDKDDDEETGTFSGVHRATELIGGSGISLDGESLVLPQDRVPMQGSALIVKNDDHDDVSSINTSIYGGGARQDFRIPRPVYHTGTRSQNLSMFDADFNSARSSAGSSDIPESSNKSRINHPNVTNSVGTNKTEDGTTPKSDHSVVHGAQDEYRKPDPDEGFLCIPVWITTAPGWLRFLIALSMALLVAAMVLISFGAFKAVQISETQSSSSSSSFDIVSPTKSPSAFFPTVPAATGAPTESPIVDVVLSTDTPVVLSTNPPQATPTVGITMQPSTSPVDVVSTTAPVQVDVSTTPPVAQATNAPVSTASPTSRPTLRPTQSTSAPTSTKVISPTSAPTRAPTVTPSMAPTQETVSFFVTAGRYTGPSLETLPDDLKTLPSYDGTQVMFHLGDWNSPFATNCIESSYEDVVALYSESTIPVYFVPGDNEYNDCPNATEAFGLWKNYVLDFEIKHFDPPTRWTIEKQLPAHPENFAYINSRILFVGINLVGGTIHDPQEWADRHQANLDWIDEQYMMNVGKVDYMVIFAHADPAIQANRQFYDIFFPRVQFDYQQMEVIFVHRNIGIQSWDNKPAFNDISNLRVVVAQGSVWPPMRIQINTGTRTVDVDQDSWHLN